MSYKFYASAKAPDGSAIGRKTNNALTHCIIGRKERQFGQRRYVDVHWQPVAWAKSEERAEKLIDHLRPKVGMAHLAIVEVMLWKLPNAQVEG